MGTAIDMICFANLAYNRECAQIVQEMWTSVGFKVTSDLLMTCLCVRP